MDNKDNKNEVSLPGAGGTESTILEVLNRNTIADCDNDATANQQQQSHLQHEDQISDASHDDNEINDNFTVNVRLGSTTPVTDLDIDDNEIDNSRVLDSELHLITDVGTVEQEVCGQPVFESLAESNTPIEILTVLEEAESVLCDIIPVSSSLSESPAHNLVDERLTVADSSTNLPTEEHRLTEFDLSSDIEVEAGSPKPWYQDDDLDPEDQKIIQEAIESVLKESQSEDDEQKTSEKTQFPEKVLQDSSILQNPLLELSNPEFQGSSKKSYEPHQLNENPEIRPEPHIAAPGHSNEIETFCTQDNSASRPLPTVENNEKTVKEETSSSPDIKSKTHPSLALETGNAHSESCRKEDTEDKPAKILLNGSRHFRCESEPIELSSKAKREYYKHLRHCLDNEFDRPPVPLKTYLWEDIRRSKEQGGYPWTHLYKRPLRPDEEPEIILLRRSQDRQKFASESPRSGKKVRIHEEVLVKETERYICDLVSDSESNDDIEEDSRPDNQRHEETESKDHECHHADNYSIQSEPILSTATSTDTDDRIRKFARLKGILKRRLSFRQGKSESAPESETSEGRPTPRKRRFGAAGAQRIAKCCHPIMNKLKSMADKQLRKRNIKNVPLKDNEKIVLSEKQKILKLRQSPKADHSTIPHFIEKQDSDDILEIIQLEESPSKARKLREEGRLADNGSSILVPDEIIELPTTTELEEDLTLTAFSPRSENEESIDESIVPQIRKTDLKLSIGQRPAKAPRRRKDHFYEDIENSELESKIDEILQEAVESATRISMAIEAERSKLSPERTEQCSDAAPFEGIDENEIELRIIEDHEKDEIKKKSAMKRDTSPISDKKVTFSHVEDEAEPHREDIELPEEYRVASRWSNTADHEYEPIGQPVDDGERQVDVEKEASPIPTFQISEPTDTGDVEMADASSLTSVERTELDEAQEQQRAIEDRYFSSVATTPRTDSRTDYEIHTSQVDSSALEELPLKAENRKKGFMASAQDRSRRMSENLRTQAGKIRTKIRGTKKPATGSPKAKERKRFRKPDFSKLKMPEIKRPDLPKFKSPEFKRPEFTKFDKPLFTKPDLSRFKIPDTVTMKLRRTKSLRETEVVTETTGTSPESASTPKKKFEFNFGTYPRMLKKRRQKLSTVVVARADDLPSTETPASVESTTISRHEKGPVSPRWPIDKFSDVSYGDSESGKYQRYSSEPDSLGRESSIEQRMKEQLDKLAHEDEELEAMHSVEQKQFADYDEENRAIHEIAKSRGREFKKRRPMVHQDSDLVSEESKDIGWNEKDALRNAMLTGADAEVESLPERERYSSERTGVGSSLNETQSTASSGIHHKGVLEEIDDDEFFLRKRGISQDNIEIRQYISSAIREGLSTPENTLAKLGTQDHYYPELGVSNEDMDFRYDVPPPKPRRVNKQNDFNRSRESESQEMSIEHDRRGSYDDNVSLPKTSEFFTNIPPSRPSRKSRKQYSQDDDEHPPSEDIPYLDDQEKEINIEGYDKYSLDNEDEEPFNILKPPPTPPKAPKRRKKQQWEAVEKDSYANRFSGRSVSNSFLPNEERDDQIIVYRTQHEYVIPLAQPESFSTPIAAPRRSRSQSQSAFTDDDRTSRGADSLASESYPIEEEKFQIDIKEGDGYATVRKEPPPRPPAPRRHKRSTSPQHFATMPHPKRETGSVERSTRHFNTMGPNRPPRRRSAASAGDNQKNISSPDVTQYEELDVDQDVVDENVDDRVESPPHLHSGDVINKMKHRPLPPPPRPPRETRRKKGPRNHFDDKHDKDSGGERLAYDMHLNGNYDIEKTTEKCIEVEVSTQTDPLPDDFVCEDFEITDDMRVIEPRCGKTLQDLLKDEQETDQDRSRHSEDDSLTRGIHRFREASQRSYSERSKGSTSKASHSRPTTPNAVVLERRIPTPIPHRQGETMLEASLIVMPVDLELDEDEPKEEEQHEPRIKVHYAEELEAIEDETYDDEMGSEGKAKTESLEPEEPGRTWSLEMQTSSEEVKPQSSMDSDRLSEMEEEEEELPPMPPPRKRSSITTDASLPREEEKERKSSDERAVIPSPILEMERSSQVDATSHHPTRLALTELEVERLSVHALQAGSIFVSQLQSSSISTDEFQCRSGNAGGQNMEISSELIEEILRRVRSSERDHAQAETQTTPSVESRGTTDLTPTQEMPPPRPPPPQSLPHQLPGFPSEYMQYSTPPPSFYSLRDPSEAEHHQSPTVRRRRHHRRRDSSSEDESYREHRRSRHGTRSPEPSIGQIGGQLLQACGSSILRSMNQIANILRTNEKEGNDRNISTAIIIVILMTIGFLLLGITGNKNIHHHHWDYFNPPDNKGR